MVKTKSGIKELANLLVSHLENKNIRVEKLILFGSYAAGKAKAYSDIDIAVISPSFEGKGLLKRQELLGEAIYALKEPIGILGYTPYEYKHISPTSFLWEITSTGKAIYNS